MPLKDLSVSCSVCERTIFGEVFFLSGPSGRDAFCSPKCVVQFFSPIILVGPVKKPKRKKVCTEC
ncbi:MAG: hypothetical protein O8C67_02060, partial [Candidatus Methanoperedens sp.]|nr:hypothetical protein [Candidatus Methanoperedens sp.]